ncbi:hypothetical protein ABI59_09215 [Acidobacteria bacterium Mor1]|nr:hypothetical protein ABI59_09215 [Acidobacteria bacterium Mor1]
MSNFRWLSVLALIALCSGMAAASEGTSRLDQVLDRIVENERAMASRLSEYNPLVETYLQTVKPDTEMGFLPVKDRYFLGRLDLRDGGQAAATKRKRSRKGSSGKLQTLFDDFYSASLQSDGFAKMVVLDQGGLDRQYYDFDFIRRDFLGEIRTLVFDVVPKDIGRARSNRFTGRIWVEDEQFHIVRFNGVYGSAFGSDLHFDSWRLNMAPGIWFPAYVYTEESEQISRKTTLTHQGQTRLWGYKVSATSEEEEFAKIMIESELADDRSETPGQISPVESTRAWAREAEENVLRRLQKAGLLAPEGEVDEVLATVVANLEVTNGLTIDPPVRCRVLMTTPLESFTIGHTIVLSRGLIDVLPDEASLAMVLAHELGHILEGHRLDTRYAFSDQMLVDDKEALKGFKFKRDPAEDRQADAKAELLLEASPYADKLGNAGLFLKALSERANTLPALIRPHFGNEMAEGTTLYRMPKVLESAPVLVPGALNQTAALPLGGRVKVDPWTAEISLMKNNRVALLSAREKMPFQVTPLMPYLARFGSAEPNLAEEAVQEPGEARPAELRAEIEDEEAAQEQGPDSPQLP